MRIVTYDEVDPYEVYRLNLAAFGWGLAEADVRRIRRKDPRVFDGFAFYAVERGKPLAQVNPLRMPVRLTTGVETVGGIAGVCSHPSVWGRGYARRTMERAHEWYREEGVRIATLTTSRNIRGFRIYRRMGYVELAPFYRASRNVPRNRRKPHGLNLRRVTRDDLPQIQRSFEGYTRDLYGWTARLPQLLTALLAWDPGYLERYRLVLRDRTVVGYLRTRPDRGVLMEEVVVPRWEDFRAAVGLLESRTRGKIATVNWITPKKDQKRYRGLGYTLDGPIPDATMAVSLDRRSRSRDLVRQFGVSSGKFAHYPTDDF